ncbi:hypothetical protein H7R52_18240 [Weissella confusa]|uniref:ClpX-type ZB domain-containing protein n=1 Tax=Weissella confusa TaxID=1583 RepID=A0A923NIW8_WEICO|nr:hypothetical protein [Weissella confusa]
MLTGETGAEGVELQKSNIAMIGPTGSGKTYIAQSMAKLFNSNGIAYCSFCGKASTEVKKLIAGPGVYICNECVALAQDIINEDLQQDALERTLTLKTPREIVDNLKLNSIKR